MEKFLDLFGKPLRFILICYAIILCIRVICSVFALVASLFGVLVSSSILDMSIL